MRKFTVIHFIATLVAFGACTKPQNTFPPAPPKWLRWTIAEEPQHFHPAMCETKRCHQFVALLMEGLSREGLEDGAPKAMLALAEE